MAQFENMDLKTLADIVSGKIQLPAEFSAEGLTKEDVDRAFNEEVNRLCPEGNVRKFRENKNQLFALIEEAIDEELPQAVIKAIGDWAEIKNMKNGDKPRFKVQKNKGGIKNSVTEVALGGRMKRYKLDAGFVDVNMKAHGTATAIEKEELRMGLLNWADFKNEVSEGIQYDLYRQINTALQASVATLPATNKQESAGFDEVKFDQMIAGAKSYGDKATVICTESFAQTIPFTAFDAQAIADIRTGGYVRIYKGVTIQIMPNSFVNNKNLAWEFSNQYAYILPSNKNQKIVKVALEGTSEIDEYVDQDTKEEVFETYMKAGIAVVMQPYVFVYRNSNLV